MINSIQHYQRSPYSLLKKLELIRVLWMNLLSPFLSSEVYLMSLCLLQINKIIILIKTLRTMSTALTMSSQKTSRLSSKLTSFQKWSLSWFIRDKNNIASKLWINMPLKNRPILCLCWMLNHKTKITNSRTY